MARSITGKLIVVLILCLAVIHGTGAYLDYQSSREEILERVRLQSRDTINKVVNDLEHWLSGVQGSTLLLSRILEQKEFSLAELDQLLRNILLHEPDIYGATIALDPNHPGNPPGFSPYYYRKNGSVAYVDMAKDSRPYWQDSWYSYAASEAKPTWVEPYFDEGGGKTLMTTYSVPVFHIDPDGSRSLYAIVTADVALERLHVYLQQLRLGTSGGGMLISRQGAILSSDRPEAVMKNYLEAMSSPSDREVWQRSFNTALRGETVVFPVACPARQGQCNTLLTALTSTGWLVAVIYSQDEILAPVRAFGLKATLTGFVTLVLMAIAVSIVSRRLTRPLVALARASDSIATGQLDVPLPRARGNDEVARLVHSFRAMRRDLKAYISDLEAATAGKARLEGELTAATQIQMSMLPQGGEALEKGKCFTLWAKVRPAKSVGGDLYTFYQRGENRLFVVVGDVSDKGVPAALFMARAISHIQQFEEAFESPAHGMALLNDSLEQGNDNCMFVTLFFGVIDLATLQLRFTSAGHPPPSLLRGGRASALAQQTGPALGLARGMNYPENTFALQAGDRLALYTDGIDEAFNERAQMFTSERLERILESTSGEPVDQAGKAIFRAVSEFAGDTPQSDDITMMLIDLHPPSTPSSHYYPCDPAEIGAATDWLLELFQHRCLEHGFTMELILVAEEVLTNIHKYAQLPSPATVDLTVDIYPDRIAMEFADEGVAFDPFREGRRATLGNDIDSAEVGGLGVHLIISLTDERGYERRANRNIVRVEKYLGTQ